MTPQEFQSKHLSAAYRSNWPLVAKMQLEVAPDQTDTDVQYLVAKAAVSNPSLWDLVKTMQLKVADGQTDPDVQFLVAKAAVSNPSLWGLVKTMQNKVAHGQTDPDVQFRVAKAAESNPELWELVKSMQDDVAQDKTDTAIQFLVATAAESNPELWKLVKTMQDKVAQDKTDVTVQLLVIRAAESSPALWMLVESMQDKVLQDKTDPDVHRQVARAANSSPELWGLVKTMQDKVAPGHTDTHTQYLVAKAAESNYELWDLVKIMQDKVAPGHTNTHTQYLVAKASESNSELWDLVKIMQDKVAPNQSDTFVHYLVAKAAETEPFLWDLVCSMQNKVEQGQTDTNLQRLVALAAETNPELWDLVKTMQDKVAPDQMDTGVQLLVARAAKSIPELWDLVKTMQDKVAPDQTDTSVQLLVAIAADSTPELWDLVKIMQDKVAPHQTDTFVQYLVAKASKSKPELWNLVTTMQEKSSRISFDMLLVQLAFAAQKLQAIGIDSANKLYEENDTLAVGIDLETKLDEPMVTPPNQIVSLETKEIVQPKQIFTSVLSLLELALREVGATFPVVKHHPLLARIFIGCYRGIYSDTLMILRAIHQTIYNMQHQQNLQHLDDLSWLTLKNLHDLNLVKQDAFELPHIELAGQLLHEDYRYQFNARKQTSFWFSTKPECFMPNKQQQAVIKKSAAFLEQQIKFRLGYSASLLNASQQQAIKDFATTHGIILVNIDEQIQTTDNPLWQVIESELEHIKSQSGGNPAALSDACRMMPELIPDGFYGDLDSPLRRSTEIFATVRGGVPIMFNMGSIVSDPMAPKWSRQEAICLNNDLIGYSGTQADRAMRQNIAAYILEGYKNPSKRADLSPLKDVGIERPEKLNIFQLRQLISAKLAQKDSPKLRRLYKSLVEDVTGPGAIYNALGGVKTFSYIYRNGAILPTSSARSLQFFMSCDTKSPVKSNNIPPWLTSESQVDEMRLNEDGLSWMPTIS